MSTQMRELVVMLALAGGGVVFFAFVCGLSFGAFLWAAGLL